ncbi:MAG: efflux RND transporter periplasmic adaptor subunit [Candidatus Cloacimonetes bacterium]|nr:efflux RND transporter periplasmic adaptor subunit [Candidatus Cloacimonadota bacterium]
MYKKFRRSSLLFFFIIISTIFFGCGRRSGDFRGQGQQEIVPVIVEKVKKQDINEFVKIVGTLEGITDITLSSETNGKIVKLNKRLGDWVEKGESIGTIDNEEYKNSLEQAKASLLAAEAAFETAEMNLKSSEELYTEKSISKNDYLQAKANFKNAKAQREGAKANVRVAEKALENSHFTSPVSGYITEMHIEVGEMITAGQPVCALVDSRRLIIKTGVGESDIAQIKEGDCVQLVVQNLNRECRGTITGIGIKPSAQTANYPIEIELENPNGDLYPGMVVKGYILNKTYEDVIYTSLNNIKERYDESLVYLVDEDNKATEVLVELGKKINQGVIIKSGVKSGDLLVVEGLESLNEGTSVEIKDEF